MAELAVAQACTNATVDRTSANLDRLSEEMRAFKDEMRASNKKADRRWGELANKMGTMAEDIVAPGIPGSPIACSGPSTLTGTSAYAGGIVPTVHGESNSTKISPRWCPGSGRFESSSRRRRG